jgi:tetratricopeptide (TPR) repeat protein
MRIYSVFIEGVMTMMKKKSEEALKILSQLASSRKCDEMKLTPLVNKYFGYGYFKLSEFAKSIAYYQKIKPSEMDESSSYNKLLAEGIELADKQHRFPEAMGKFNQAKAVYPQKVEPYIYIAMAIILKRNLSPEQDEGKLAEALIDALKELELGNKLNPNSSNLLYHRTIIHLFFEDWE